MRVWQRALICLLLVAGLVLPAGAAQAAGRADEYVAGQVVAMLRDGASIAAVCTRYGVAEIGHLPDTNTYLLQLPPGKSVDQALRQMRGDKDLAKVEPNYTFRAPEAQQFSLSFDGQTARIVEGAGGAPDARYFGQDATLQVGLDKVHSSGAGVVVAILDTGVDSNHPALLGKLASGRDFVDRDDDPSEVPGGIATGHGTFLAGIVALIAPDSTILPIRVLDAHGRGSLFSIAGGLAYAVERADALGLPLVINLSLGSPKDSAMLEEAVLSATSKGAIVVASVGNRTVNDRNGGVFYPARYGQVVAVAAVDGDDVKTVFSNWGKETDLSAPGSRVYSSYPDNRYAFWSGTSFSAAFVSGGAALVQAQHPEWTASQVVTQLKDTAVDVDAVNYPELRGKLGAGRIDLEAATETGD